MLDNFTPAMLNLFATSLWETLVMVAISGVAGSLIGIPLGVLRRLTDRGWVLQNAGINRGSAASSTPSARRRSSSCWSRSSPSRV